MNQIEAVISVLVLVAALGIVAKRIALPYPVLLVVSGLGLGFVPGLPTLKIDPEIVLLCVLPPLLYPAALYTSWREFRADLPIILRLAIGLVLVTTLAVGYVAHALGELPWAAAFALGAIVSPPDAVAATAITKRLRLPSRIVAVLEGESLVNDATALVAVRFAIAAAVTGSFSARTASLHFFGVAAGGIAMGLIIAWLASRLQRLLDDVPVQITISLLTPFAAYLPAERLHVSGVLAVVTAGLFLGWRAPQIITSRMRINAQAFWEMVEFLLNGLVFVMIGLQLRGILDRLSGESFGRLCLHAAILSATVIGVRILWVFPANYLPAIVRFRKGRPLNWRQVLLVGWTGMRGVVSLAVALALPLSLADGAPFPGRDYILFVTFFVIMVTLVLQGLSLPLVIRILGIKDDGAVEMEERTARIQANEAALARVLELRSDPEFPAELLDRIEAEYFDRLRELEACGHCAAHPGNPQAASLYERIEQETLTVERQTIIRLRDEYIIGDEVLRRIQRDLDLAEARLREKRGE